MSYNLILIPEGSVLPEDLQSHFADAPDILQKILAGQDKPVIIAVNTRELQMIVEYRDLFDADCTAIIGMQGAMYNTVWNTYVSTMERTTLEAYRATIRTTNDELSQQGTDAVVRPSRSARVARLVQPVTKQDDEAPDESNYTTD